MTRCISFAYAAGLLAALASSKFEATAALASSVGTSTGRIVAIAILLFDFIYLTLVAACIFAVMKRGLYILESTREQPPEGLVLWEMFCRKSKPQFRHFAWNIDNYYVGVMYSVIVVISVLTFVYGLTGGWDWFIAAVFVLGALHVIPIWALLQAAKVEKACRARIQKICELGDHEQP